MLNDDPGLVIPQTGLSSVAQIFSTDSGPFTLTQGEDTLTIETPAGSFTASLGITGKVRWGADQVIQKLMRQGLTSQLALAENINGHLLISDTNTVGPDSFVRISGTGAESLGFGATGNTRQRSARGRRLYPSWNLEIRPDTITNRAPKFTSRVRSNPTIKVTYSVPVSRCLRCRATYVENDIRFSVDGNPVFVDDEDLLQQAALKVILTDRGSNPYHNWYGTTIRSRIGSKAIGNVAAALQDDIRRALTRYQRLQKAQAEVQPVSPKERLYAVLSIQVLPHEQDLTTFLVDVWVQNASSEPIQLNTVFTVPEVVALMGSNGLFLGGR
jgi:phage baseplate assembly protein W